MRFKIIAAAAVVAALCCMPALSGCFGETYIEYTLYSSEDEVIRTDNFSVNPDKPDGSSDGDSVDSQDPAPEGSYYMVTGYSGKPVDLVVPAEIGGTPVRGIGEQAFINCKSLVTLTVEEGVSEVGIAAFVYCISLQEAVLPSTMNVGESMFGGCDRLQSVTLPEGITSIGNRAFQQCYALSEINADESNPVNLPSTLTFIGGNAFFYCYELSGEIVIPAGVTEIMQYSFANCINVTSFVIDGDVTAIGDGAFGGCHSAESIDIPSAVTSIGNYAFSNTYEFDSLTLPEKLTYLGQYAFQASGVTSVAMPQGKGVWLYTEELAEDDPETEEDESIAPGSEEAGDLLFSFYYSEDVKDDPSAKGRIPSYELTDGEQAAEWLKDDLLTAYWYFVAV